LDCSYFFLSIYPKRIEKRKGMRRRSKGRKTEDEEGNRKERTKKGE
jgi:hypothetical protein